MLVVDGDPDLSALTATWLRMTGFEVVTVADGARALDLMSDQHFDAVIVDLPLQPGVDTSQVLAQFRTRRPGCRTVVTSVLDADDYPAADAALPKPFSRAQLIAAVLAPAELPAARVTADRDRVPAGGVTEAARS